MVDEALQATTNQGIRLQSQGKWSSRTWSFLECRIQYIKHNKSDSQIKARSTIGENTFQIRPMDKKKKLQTLSKKERI